MLTLVENLPGTGTRIFSGLEPGGVERALLLAAAELKKDREEEEDGKAGRAAGGGLGTVILSTHR